MQSYTGQCKYYGSNLALMYCVSGMRGEEKENINEVKSDTLFILRVDLQNQSWRWLYDSSSKLEYDWACLQHLVSAGPGPSSPTLWVTQSRSRSSSPALPGARATHSRSMFSSLWEEAGADTVLLRRVPLSKSWSFTLDLSITISGRRKVRSTTMALAEARTTASWVLVTSIPQYTAVDTSAPKSRAANMTLEAEDESLLTSLQAMMVSQPLAPYPYSWRGPEYKKEVDLRLMILKHDAKTSRK